MRFRVNASVNLSAQQAADSCLGGCRVVVFLLMAFAACSAFGAEFYVSPSGFDGNPGTLELPFATVDRARVEVRSLLAGGLSEDVWVYLRGGVYRIESPIEFDPSDSAPVGFHVNYVAYEDERPVMSGGRLIENWTDNGDGTWSTTVADVASGTWAFRELFVNGVRRKRARHPNSGWLHVAGPNPKVGPDTRFTFAFAEGDLPGGMDYAGAELNMLHEWTTSRVQVASVDHTARTVTTAEPLGAFGLIHSIFQTEDHPRYAIENHIALLDAPGEWFLDEPSGVLTYRPMPGEFPSTVEVVAPIAKALLVARGNFADGTPVRNLRFVNLAFEHCGWDLVPGGYSTYQSGYYEERDIPTYELPAAVKFEVAEGCELLRTRVSHCGGWGVMLGAWCRNCSLIGSIVTDIAGNGVLVGEDRFRRVADNNYWHVHNSHEVAVGNQVISNVVQDCGVVFQGCAGLWVGLTDGSNIHNNLIRRIPHIGISAGGFWNDLESPARDLSIVDNRIQDVVQLMSDGGGLYTVGWQPDSIVRGNLISDIPSAPGLAQNPAIFMDEGTTDFTVLNNGIFNVIDSPFKFHWAGVNELKGNNMRLSASDIEPYYFQNTNMADITRTDDLVIDPASPPVGCEYPVCGKAASAGLLAEHATWIYTDSDGDGVPDLEDACVERKPGDVSGDGLINGLDIGLWVHALDGEEINHHDYCAADVDGSGFLDPIDADALLSILLQP